MKVTINLISNIFIAGIVSILPYLSMIRGAIGSENSNILLYLPVMILPFVTYIISAFGLEMAEQGYKGRQEKSAVSTIYFIMLISTIIVPDYVEIIGPYAFSGCNNLTNVVISNGVKTIGQNAFDSCSSLSSIAIPSSVTNIGV